MSGYQVAKQFIGKHEIRDRKELAEFMKKYKMPIDPATTPWCAAFVNACERASGNAGNGKYNARSFLTYGRLVTKNQATKGDIVIFSRGGSSWQGHVSYFDGWEESRDGLMVRCLGGNQGDMVKYSWYPADRLLGFRRP